MAALFFLALLPGGEHRLPAVIRQEHGAAVAGLEISCAELPAINEGKRQPIGQNGPQFLHQVKRQARAARPVAVEKADSGIEADTFGSTAAIMRQERVEEGQ